MKETQIGYLIFQNGGIVVPPSYKEGIINFSQFNESDLKYLQLKMFDNYFSLYLF